MPPDRLSFCSAKDRHTFTRRTSGPRGFSQWTHHARIAPEAPCVARELRSGNVSRLRAHVPEASIVAAEYRDSRAAAAPERAGAAASTAAVTAASGVATAGNGARSGSAPPAVRYPVACAMQHVCSRRKTHPPKHKVSVWWLTHTAEAVVMDQFAGVPGHRTRRARAARPAAAYRRRYNTRAQPCGARTSQKECPRDAPRPKPQPNECG